MGPRYSLMNPIERVTIFYKQFCLLLDKNILRNGFEINYILMVLLQNNVFLDKIEF